ncbi:MAG: hypothetical protein HY721_05880 [Planctomycetes bacterium]|nr:hypothetical protein [Planctomycetota bacterium]
MPRELWDAWLALSFRSLGRSSREVLADFPTAGGAVAAGEGTYADDLRWLLGELDGSGVIRIECGGKDLAGASGARWGRDRFFLGGKAARSVVTVKGSAEEELYRTSRAFGEEEVATGYRLPLPDGAYRVTLHFCEARACAEGVNVFDVLLEGEEVLAACDPIARRGFGMAWIHTAEVAVADGALDIELQPRRGEADVAALEVGPRR